ncbi:MAG: PilZ domain-containing protein [Bdellovibrionaceae bacterium]|nr:PilZ domain-containing protein [Pseudobdellovibrionaceae bacterium]|tara:strand:- start:65696 stop:66223 length:528 start_codon:yes stop_codon:yes gene_type:complete
MSQNNNVIDFQKHLKNRQAEPAVDKAKKSTADVVNMTERRSEILKEERRQVKRTILTEFIGASVVVPQKGLMKVALYDISDQGISFDMEGDSGHFKVGEEVAMRVYLNHQTFFPFSIVLKNVQEVDEEAVYRHGGQFVQGTLNDEALHHFVKFIETVSASLRTDSGDIMVSNLNK